MVLNISTSRLLKTWEDYLRLELKEASLACLGLWTACIGSGKIAPQLGPGNFKGRKRCEYLYFFNEMK
jgi:hypothetical protein